MQENNFEKDVQQSMGGLKIQPSAEVWNNLEKLLQQKKKRRFTFLLLLVAIFIITGAGAWYFTGSPGAASSRDRTAVVNIEGAASDRDQTAVVNIAGAASDTEQHSMVDTGDTAAIDGQRTNTETVAPLAEPAAIDDQQTLSSNPTVAHSADSARRKDIAGSRHISPGNAIDRSPKTLKPSSQERTQDYSQSRPLPSDKTTKKVSDELTSSAVTSSSDQTTATHSQELPSSSNKITAKTSRPETAFNNKPHNDSAASIQRLNSDADHVAIASDNDSTIHSKQVPVITQNQQMLLKDSLPGKFSDPVFIPKTMSASRNSWVIGVSAGVSRLSKLPSPGSKDNSSAPLYSSPVFNNGLPSAPAAILPPSDIRAGLAFTVSGGLQHFISERSSFFTGLAYSYRSHSIRVGNYGASNISFQSGGFATGTVLAYTGARIRNFTNQYHLVSIPLRYQLIIAPFSRVPVRWNLGVSPGYLSSENALVYWSSLGGSYHRDNKAFNRFGVDVTSGFDLLFTRNGFRWSVGPEASFAPTRLTSNKEDNRQHPFYGGISAKVYLRR